MVRKEFLTHTIFIILLSRITVATQVGNTPQLRIFPELRGEKIEAISVIDPNKAIAASKEALFKWEGNTWQEFYPPFPQKKICLDFLKAFSFKNIWVFYRKEDRYYRSDIYHFNGDTWQKIPSQQPYTLTSAGFIDSKRFFATGDWGNLIYFDGKAVINIPNPGGFSSRIAKVFNSSHFFIWTKVNDSASEHVFWLYEYDKGAWKVMGEVKHLIWASLFLKPDSGYFTTKDGFLFQYSKNKITFVDSFPLFPTGPHEDMKVYYWKDEILWSYDIATRERAKIASVPFSCIPTFLGENEFLLQDNDNTVYYLGKRAIGKPIKKQQIEFILYSAGQNPSQHFGVSSYWNRQKGIDLYFTNLYETNNFYTFEFSKNDVGYKDVLLNRQLIGYEKANVPEDTLDLGVFFADIDNDGDQDAVCAALRGRSLLYENLGDDKFMDITEEMHFPLDGRFYSVGWNDWNGDGLLDAVGGDITGPLHFLLNEGYFRFRDVTPLTGIPDTLKHYSSALADMDNDGDSDLFLYNVYGLIRYFENEGVQATSKLPLFVDVSARSPQLTTRFDFFTQSMAFGDYDNDGDLDLFLANRASPLKLFQNDGHGMFTDMSNETGFNQSVLAYGANWGDLDQDGYLDLFLTTLGSNYVFWNHEGKFFESDSTCLPKNDLGYSMGSVLEDMDRDGDLDIVVANCEISYSRIYLNMLNRNHCIKVGLRGTKSNFFGIGGRVWLYESGHANDLAYLRGFRQVMTNTGYCSSCLPEAYFGVSPEKRYDVVVEFPNGQRVEKLDLIAGKTCIVQEEASLYWKAGRKFAFFGKFIYRPKYRLVLLQVVFFILVLLLFNLYIHLKAYWPTPHILIFGISLFSFFIVTMFLFSSARMNLEWFLPIFSTAIIGILLSYIMQRNIAKRYKSERQSELYDLMRQFHHNKEGMKQVDHLALFLNNISRTTQDVKMRESFRNELETCHVLTLPMIRRLLDEGKRLGLPRAKVGLMETNIKQLYRNISKLLRDFQQPSSVTFESNQAIDYLASSIKKLKNGILSMRREVEMFFAIDPLRVLNDVVVQYPQFMEVSRINLCGEKSLKVIIPYHELASVFTNLFDNALDSMRHKKDKRIFISVEPLSGQTLAIKIQDFGEGIHPDHHSIIFEESFSTKGPSGIGLFNARKYLRRYGGDIELLQSAPDEGAVFQIKLRVLEK